MSLCVAALCKPLLCPLLDGCRVAITDGSGGRQGSCGACSVYAVEPAAAGGVGWREGERVAAVR